MTGCTLCPRRCGADRNIRPGYCGSGEKARVARAKLHFWEEPPISGTRGSGAIFFTGCSLRCAFCQNSEISGSSVHGRDFETDELIALMQSLEAQGAHNINLVTPTHFAGQIAAALQKYKPKIPVVYNCGGYESVDTLRRLEGLIDIYLPDFKYADDALAVRISNAADYRETALAAIREMVRQTGGNAYAQDGLLQKGILIRHLILPGHTRNSMAVLDLIRENFPDVPVSLMSQYTPMGRVLTDERFSDLNRRITLREHRKVQDYMLALELPGFCQKRSAAGERYIPDFTQFDAIPTEGGAAFMNGGNQTDLPLYSPMEKLFGGEKLPAYGRAGALRGEETAFQTVVSGCGTYRVEVRTDAPADVELYRVASVPCGMPAYPDRCDADYITTEPGRFPDVLVPLEADGLLDVETEETLWVSLRVRDDAPGGTYPVEVSADGRSAVFMLTVIPVKLPDVDFTFTQWFHADCIASLHNVEIYSEAHWALLGKYMRAAARHGVNMLLTPVFTPALDTAVGSERPCTQLVGIARTESGYAFDFSLLKRWVDLARACGIQQFEISHFFTQWGAKCAPNIYVTENGARRLAFGWHTAATDPAYGVLLRALIPALLAFFAADGIGPDALMFHISDEPGAEHLDSYLKAKQIVAPLLSGYTIRDALSDYDFYASGVVEHPVVATDHLEPFLENHVPGLWAYVCCAQHTAVGNRFLAMPSNRNRILGVQLWKYRITGFLQWGFNFWYAQESKSVIDPFRVTDANGAFPGGDAFSVYPGKDGPLLSIRLKVFAMALYDLRALQLLESRIGLEKTRGLLGEGGAMTFKEYPRSADYLPQLRERVNAAIAAAFAEE